MSLFLIKSFQKQDKEKANKLKIADFDYLKRDANSLAAVATSVAP